MVLNFLGNSEVWAVLLHESGIASEMFDVQVHVLVNQALTLQFSTNNPHRHCSALQIFRLFSDCIVQIAAATHCPTGSKCPGSMAEFSGMRDPE